MFDILPPSLKSFAVRTKVKYAPHPYVWMAPAHAMSTGLGIETEGLELPLSELPPWSADKLKILPVVWKNPVTGSLHVQVHPCGVRELFIDPLPEGASREGALYPDGAHLTDLKEVRDLLYKMQRPAIAPPQEIYLRAPPTLTPALPRAHRDRPRIAPQTVSPIGAHHWPRRYHLLPQPT